MLRHAVWESLVNLWRNRYANLLAAGTIAVSLLVLGIFLLVAHNLTRAVSGLTSQITVSVYLLAEATSRQQEEILSAAREHPGVESANFISPEEARERFRKYFPAMREVADTLDENPFPSSIEIRMAEGHRDPERIREFVEGLRPLEGVEDAAFDLPYVTRAREVVGLAKAAGYALGGVLGLAAILTIASVIRMTIYSRQREIEILRLVGATRLFIVAPFLLEASFMGLLGGGLALFGLRGLHRYLEENPVPLSPLFNEILAASFLPTATAGKLVLLGLLAGAAGGLLSLRKLSL